MFSRSIHLKILSLVMGFVVLAAGISIYAGVRSKERELLDEKLRASRLMAEPVLNAIYEDMLEHRADLARRLLHDLGKAKGIGELFIVRGNGVEEAFADRKTIMEVKAAIGRARPEWEAGHRDESRNVAPGVDSPRFKEAFRAFQKDWSAGPVHYIDTQDGVPLFVYLQPIEKKPGCRNCHIPDEGARGILVIRTPLDGMYAALARGRNRWMLAGLLSVAAGGMLLSVLIRRSVTGPIRRNVEVIKAIADGTNGMGERLTARSGDEIGYLASAFNEMLDTLERRQEDNRKLLELATNSREEFQATFDAIQDMISIHDRDRRILKVNRALADKLGSTPEAIVGRRCSEIFYCRETPRASCPHERTFDKREAASDEVDDMCFEGTYQVTTFPIVNDGGEVWASVHYVRDVTREKLMRDQLFHAEKLSSVGKLVAGIAHELNNPLMGIMGFSQLLMDMQGDRPVAEAKDRLRRIYNESVRTAKIVQNLLAFARSKQSEREWHDVNDIIRQTVDLREYSMRTNNIAISLDLESGIPRTMVDIYQMQQVFINIMNNAEDAIVAAKGRGRIDIKTRRGKRRNIEISFADDGPGVPKAVIRKVFDPFFTTKEVGKGTGLGLSISHGIITEHGGAIGIDSPEAGGAVVSIELPIVEREQWMEVKKAVDTAEMRQMSFTDKRALIVDDEPSIREALRDILIKWGFKADIAADGRGALDALERGRYALLITDIRMAGLNGAELYDSILAKHAYLKDRTIIVTGDVLGEDVKRFLARTGCPHILKPFEPNELIEMIKVILA
ncbi:MAG: response regulator [Deltaproteobacteria bacterium]|nr:response regulator [Deltaproteobacteria bacterium]